MIFAVVVGMAAGAGALIVAGTGMVLVSGAAFLMKPRARPDGITLQAFLLHLRVGLGHDIETLVGGTLDAHLSERSLVSMSTARQGIAVEVSIQGRLRDNTSVEACIKALNRIEGVQRVELARLDQPDIRERP